MSNDNTVFQDVLSRAASQGKIITNTNTARNWMTKNISSLGRIASPTRVVSTGVQNNRGRAKITIGRMYMFLYDPKTKADLPYWDKFPLVFPFDKAPGGFYGLNLHYLPPILRAKLFDGLTSRLTNPNLDDTTRLRLSYQTLKSVASIKYYQPCIKRYLNNHVRSQFIYVEPKEWTAALFLPTERFQKATKESVWKDSRRSAF